VHIAFFNRSFYPDTAATGQLLTELCEGLVRDHHCRVPVVAGVPLLPAARDEASETRGYLFNREQYKGIQILRGRGTRFSKRRFAGRFSNYVSYVDHEVLGEVPIEDGIANAANAPYQARAARQARTRSHNCASESFSWITSICEKAGRNGFSFQAKYVWYSVSSRPS